MSLYDALDVPTDAPAAEIKRAYRRKAQKAHPDRDTSPGAKDRFQALAKAYDVLSDPDKRARYDQTGDTQEGPDLESQALSYVAALVHAFLDQIADVEHVDLIAQLRQKCQADTQACQTQKAKFNGLVERRKRALKRLTGAAIQQMIEAEIRQLEDGIVKTDKQAEVFTRAGEIVAGHAYRCEAMLQAHPLFRGAMFSTVIG